MRYWNSKTGRWEEEDTSNQIWSPKNGGWINVDEMNTLEQQSKQEKESKKKQDSFSSASKNLLDTVKNSAVKNHGFSLSNVITDVANFGEGLKDTVESVPLIGSTVKFGNKALSSAANIATNMGEGALRTSEGILDFATKTSDAINNNIEYQMNKVFLGKDKAKETYERKKKASKDFISRDLTTELLNKTGYNDEEFHKNFEKGSIVKRDNLGGQIAQGIGGMVPSLLAGQYFGFEAPSKALDGLKGLNKVKTVASNIGKQAVANLASTSTLGMGTYGQSLQDAYQNGATDEEATRYAIGSTVKEIATEWITGGIPGLNGTGGLDKPIEKLINKSTGKLKNEYAKAIAKSLMSYGYKFVGEGLEEGLSEIIDPYLKNATYSKDEKVNWEEVLNSFIVGGITGGILEAPNSITDFRNNMVEANNNIQQNKPMLPTGQINTIEQSTEGNPLIESNATMLPLDKNSLNRLNNQPNLNENIQPNINTQVNQENVLNQDKNAFAYEQSDNPKIDNLRKSASQFMNNSNETKAFVETVEKVISDKNYNIAFDNTIGDNVNGRIAVNENGEVDIRINPNSESAGEFILTHEITHAIETKEMTDLVIDYASKNKDFNDALNSLKEVYGTDEVNAEVLADISGQLFGNQEFINTLSIKKPSIFKKIYNSIISLANKITGNSRESLFIKDLKNKWEAAYRETENNLSKDVQYMITGKKGNSQLDKQYNTKEFINNYNEAKSMERQTISKDKIRKETGWYKDVNGDWKFEISDEAAKLKTEPTANTTYKLNELLEHNFIYDMYKGLGNTKVIFKDLGKIRGMASKITGNLYINNNLINNQSQIEKTLLHEIQHNIQLREGFQNGTTKEKEGSYEKYKNNFGETEARETAERKNLTLEERINNPSYTQIYGENSNKKLYTKEDTKWYYYLGGKSNEIVQKNQGEIEENLHNVIHGRVETNKELDDSSFSLSESSKDSNKWQQFVESNFKSTGTKTHFENTKNDVIDTKQKLINKEADRLKKKYYTESNKNKKSITKEVSKILEFDNYKQKRDFTNLVSEYYENPDLDKIKQDIKDNFGEKRIEYVNDYVKDIKNVIRGTDLQITDYVRRNFADFGNFRKDNFNKLKLKNQGQSIDSFYSELSNDYPSIFSKDITNEVDQLARLSEFMNEDEKFYGKYNLDDNVIDKAAQYVYDSVKNKDNIDDLINSISISPKQIRKEKTIEYREYAENFVNNSNDWTDKKLGLSFKTNTMKRNFYDVMGKKDGERLYHSFIEPIFNHNAQMQEDISSYNDKLSKLKLNDKESTAVQMFGEYKYNPETLVTGMEVDDFISQNKLDYKKIENAVEVFRSTYDELIERINDTLKTQGYKEIDYRKGYFPHFVEEGATTKFGKVLEKMGWKFKDNSVPTDIAGITDTFKPGKVWNRNAQQRKGKYTDFNALKGFDSYVRGAMETIYFTEDIQKLRALENEIRYQHSDKNIQTQIDEILSDTSMDFEDRQDKIDKVYAKYRTPLNNLVSEIRDYTNGIANKKSILDRTIEQSTNRKVYSVMQNVSSRLSANMVGLNLSSAMTNFIPITQAASQVKSKYLLKGLRESIKNQAVADNFESKSVFLTSRLNEADKLYKTRLEKFSEKANFMFDGIDSITANTIVRGKYYENIANGMNEYSAMRNADEFARDLMAGRAKGEMPTIFNSKNPLIKLFTSFQLEVNNQYQYMFKDLPRDLGDETKKKLIGAFVKMFFGAWMYNQLTEKIVGRKSAFSPADTIKEIYDISANEDLKISNKSSKILENLTQDIPFVGGLVGGGRLPISSVANPLNVIKGESTIGDEAKKLLYYTVLPFGGGQLKKTVDGISMYTPSKKTKGSYTSSGKLRFEAKTDPISVGKNILFGQYSSEEAQKYFNNGYLPIDPKTLEKLDKKGVSVSEYRQYSDDSKKLGLNKIKSDKDSNNQTIKGSATAKKALAIMNSDYSKKEKNYLLSTLSSSDDSVTVEEISSINKDDKTYKFYFSLDKDGRKKFHLELDELNISQEKLIDYYDTRREYKDIYTSIAAKDKIMDYINNLDLDDNAKWYLYSKDYGSDDLKNIADRFNIKYEDYYSVTKYTDEISIKYCGTNNSNKRKTMVFNYINNLKLNKVQKSILFKQAGYSDSTGKKIVFDYIDSLSMSKSDKKKLYNSIY